MNLYILSNMDYKDHDDYSMCVVAAPDAETARYMHPDGFVWDATNDRWASRLYSYWCRPYRVAVEYIGTARPDAVVGVLATGR